jgi:hypothetical protein
MEAGLKALEFQLHQAREAFETAQKIEDLKMTSPGSSGTVNLELKP